VADYKLELLEILSKLLYRREFYKKPC